MKGTYLLLINLNYNIDVQIGKLGKIHFIKGWYVYVGSAMNNLEARINRHLRSNKKHHWHIDYLLDFADIKSVFLKEGTRKEECSVALSFSSIFSSIKKFGSSDCSCLSHLFVGKKEDLEQMIYQLQFKSY